MKIARHETILARGTYPASPEWERYVSSVAKGIEEVCWPVGSPLFTIYPESGKKRGMGNGVVPIKASLVGRLAAEGWSLEGNSFAQGSGLGDFDALIRGADGRHVAVEWETGNISSSHRAVNKMALGLLEGHIAGGILILPTRQLARFLTDRIGNFEELQPYFPIWRALPIRDGVLEIIGVVHDAESELVPRIPKGSDGRARG